MRSEKLQNNLTKDTPLFIIHPQFPTNTTIHHQTTHQKNSNKGRKPKMSKTQQTQQKDDFVEELLDEKEESWKTSYKQNDPNKQGAEVEDITIDEETLEPSTNEDAEETFHNIAEEREVEYNKQEREDQEDDILGVKIDDSELVEDEEDFQPEIDTDFSPHQSEVATEVVENPADLIYRTEKWRQVRDKNLPEGLMSVEIGNSPGMLDFSEEGKFNIKEFMEEDLSFEESDRRPKPRYIGFVDADGEYFFAMGAPGATQLNSGIEAETDEEVDQTFKKIFNGNGTLSILDVTQGLSTLFDADPIIKDGERQVESGRDLIYDLFEVGSNAVKRNDEKRWEEELENALETNENYGYIEEVTEEVESVRDYQELVIDSPAKLGPVTESEYIEAEFELDEDTWFVVDQEKEEGKTLREVMEEREELQVKVLDEGEMKEAKINYNEMSEEDLEEHFSTFFTRQNSMIRPDVAPKPEGVIEVRNFSNSERTNIGLVTQKAMLSNYEGVRQAFENKGLTNGQAKSQRHQWVVDGLDAELPDGTSMNQFYKEELLPELVEGVRESFTESQLPYTLERTLAYEDDVNSAAELENYLNQFNDLDSFLDYQLEIENEVSDQLGTLEFDKNREEYEVFEDWFVNSYEEEMKGYLDEGTLNAEIQENLEDGGLEQVYERFNRKAS